jgi:hypothetical protein
MLLNEQGYPPGIIKLELAHAERNKVRLAYNKAQRVAACGPRCCKSGRTTSTLRGSAPTLAVSWVRCRYKSNDASGESMPGAEKWCCFHSYVPSTERQVLGRYN